MDKPTPYIGMKVWRFDQNRRVYAKDGNGRPVGGRPIWREHWRQLEIVGETSRSWLVGAALWRADKVPKKNWPGEYAFSEEEIDRRGYVEDRHRLVRRVQDCRDYDTLKKIEAALNEHGGPHER